MKKHFDRQIELLRSAGSFDENQSEKLFRDCVSVVRKKRSIIATGLGKNVPICEKFIGTLNSLSVRARFMHTNSAIHGDLGMVEDYDLVIVLSKSGDTDETMRLLQLLSGRNVKVWLLTCNHRSRGSRLAHNTMILPIEHEGDPWDTVPNVSSLVFLVFLQSIAMALIEKVPVRLELFKQNHPGGAIGKKLKKNEKTFPSH